jgi:hypothetical protein
MGFIDFHDMLKNRHVANCDHRLWTQVTLFRDTGSSTARKNDRFHDVRVSVENDA